MLGRSIRQPSGVVVPEGVVSLRPRLILTGAVVAAAAALMFDFAVTRVRDWDRARALDRVAAAMLTDIMRESCEADPRWFLAGPRFNRPSAAERQMPDADVYLARPSPDPLPFELFAYDDQFLGSSSAAPRLPEELKRELRSSREVRSASSRFETDAGAGWQTARLTGWTPGPCALLLFRIRPEPGAGWRRAALAGTTFVLVFAGTLVAALPTAARIRRLAASARESARQEYASKVSISGSDEIASLGAVFNEASAELRRKMVDAADREDALQRHVATTTEDVAAPLATVEASLGALDRDNQLPAGVRDRIRESLRETHELVARLANLAAVVRLRTGAERLRREPIDVRALVERVVAERQALARASGVTVAAAVPPAPVPYEADPSLLARAFGNVVDNAVLHNRPGGRVSVELKGYGRDGRFALRIADSGPGVNDEEYAGLTANKRFRGDEARTRRPGGRGLGLAVAREVADRFGLQMDLRRPSEGGLEVEFTVRTSS
jgi:signal transduction histidine kinase